MNKIFTKDNCANEIKVRSKQGECRITFAHS